MDIASPITAVKGIGEKTQKAFAKMGEIGRAHV